MAIVEKLAQLAGAGLFLVPGWALVQLLPAARAWGRLARGALAFLLGVAWLAGGLFALSHLAAAPLRRPAIGAVLVVPLALLLARRLRRRGAARPPRAEEPAGAPPSRLPAWLRGAAVTLAAVLVAGVLAEAVSTPLHDWDGRMTWATIARYMRAEHTVTPTVLQQPGFYLSHPWYPPLLPVAQVVVLEALDAAEDQHLFRGFYAFFFPVWLLVIHDGARRLASERSATVIALVAALLPVAGTARWGGATSAYSDLPLACFWGAGLIALLLGYRDASGGVIGGVLLAAGALCKNEGLLLAAWALLLAGGVIVTARNDGGASSGEGGRGGRWGPLLGAAAVVVSAALLLLGWRDGDLTRFASDHEHASWSRLWPGALQRLPTLLPLLRAEMITPQAWGLFWSLAPLLLLAGWRGLRGRLALPLGLAALAPPAVGWAAYAVSLHPEALAKWTWNRFLLQGSVPLLLLCAMALEDLLARSWRARGAPETEEEGGDRVTTTGRSP